MLKHSVLIPIYGFNFFNDPTRLYEDANKKEVIYKTGLTTLDDMIGGGIHEKSLNLIMASTNIGKTLIMCSLASNFVQNGYKVLYVTFEDPENKIAARIGQNLFDITNQQFKLMSLNDYGKAFKKAKERCGGSNLIIKEYPEYTTSALHLKSLIKDLNEKQRFMPDIVLIDYIGCMLPNGKPNPNLNSNTILLNIAMQVRALSMEFGFPVISASQTNRGGYGASEISLSDAADSFGQNMKADAVFGVTQTPEMLEQGIYQVQLLKTRYGNKKGSVDFIKVDIEKQKITDLDDKNKMKKTSTSIIDVNANMKKENKSEINLDELDSLI